MPDSIVDPTQDRPTRPVSRLPVPRLLQFALSLTALALAGAASLTASRAAQGIAIRFQLGALEPLMTSLFLLFLVVVGFRALDWMAARGWKEVDVLPLPRRAGWLGEWGTGAAIGWGLCLAGVLPVLLSLNLHARIFRGNLAIVSILLALATLLVVSLAEEAIFRGYPFARLAEAVGPSWASVLLSLGFAVTLLTANPPRHVLFALADGLVFGLVLSMAYLRTHALWLGWGLHFAYRAVAAVALGLPIAGHGEFGALLDTYASGPRWLSGGAFGLDAAFLTLFVMLAGMVAVYRLTREYAWRYTQRVLVGAAYEVAVAPPTAHTAMEREAAAAPAPLVQILSTTSQTRSILEENGIDPLTRLPPPP